MRAENRKWYIYILVRSNGKDFYVGRTFNPKLRLIHHRVRFGSRIKMRLVQEGFGTSAAAKAEVSWICKLLEQGVRLANKMKGSGGAWETSPATMKKLRAASKRLWENPEFVAKQREAMLLVVAKPGYKKERRKIAQDNWKDPKLRKKMLPQIRQLGRRERTPEARRKLSEQSKGKPRNWTRSGAKRVQKTQFKPGVNTFANLSPEKQEAGRAARRKQWENISPDERSRKATERNLNAWKNATPEQRAARGEAIRRGQLAKISPKRRSEIGRIAAAGMLAKYPDHGKKASQNIKKWWASLTPKTKKEYIARRAVKIAEAKAAKKLIA